MLSSKGKISNCELVYISRVHHISAAIWEVIYGFVLTLMDVIRVNNGNTDSRLILVRNPPSVRLIESIHQGIWVHVQVSSEVVLLTVLEAALHEELDSCVFIPNDDSCESIHHFLDEVVCGFGGLPAASGLLWRTFALKIV